MAKAGFQQALRWKRPMLFGVVAILASGCGLQEYEAKIVDAQKFLKYTEEENKLLGGPIDGPPRRNQPTIQANPGATGAARPVPRELIMFLRLPRGVATNYDPQPLGEFLFQCPGKLIDVPGGLTTMFPKGPPSANTPTDAGYFQAVYVGATKTKSRSEFWGDILRNFPVAVESSQITTILKSPLRRSPMSFDSLSFTIENLGMSYYIFVHEGNATAQLEGEERALVGIVYLVPIPFATKPEVARTIDFSVQSLAMGREANQARSRYRPPAPPPQAKLPGT